MGSAKGFACCADKIALQRFSRCEGNRVEHHIDAICLAARVFKKSPNLIVAGDIARKQRSFFSKLADQLLDVFLYPLALIIKNQTCAGRGPGLRDCPGDATLVRHAEDQADFSRQNLLCHKNVKKLTTVTTLQRFRASQTVGLIASNCRAGAPPATQRIGKPLACPTTVERDGNLLMTTRLLCFCAFLFSILAASILLAQEETPPGRLPISGASPAASPAATTPPLSSSVTPAPSPSAPQLTDVLFKNLKARSIGPAVMGGRVSDIAIDPHNPFVFYVGLGHGGVFKTNDNGVTFDPIFDKQPVLSIGAVAVAPSDSDVIWVGTGEANDRNSSDWGDGVYRSTDGGEKWQNVGLKESRSIARIVVDPKKPEVAYVAAMGNLWKDGGERGLFKTTDAGTNWALILHVAAPQDARTGCGDVLVDPTNPQIVYAALYARQRTPWSFTSGPSLTG